jgi:hypothetical protein
MSEPVSLKQKIFNLFFIICYYIQNFDIHEIRKAFPRFYFLSREEISEVLENRDANLFKLFERINSLEYDANHRVTALISKEN